MAAMVEAGRDGRLDAREQDSLARHLAACASCRALDADLALLGGLAARPILPPRTPLEHQRSRLALLNQVAVGGVPDRAKRRARPWVALAAAALVATVGLLAHEASRDHDGGGPRPPPNPPDHAVALARKMPPPRTVEHVRLVTTVRGAAGARFTRVQTDREERVELDDGAIDLEVRRLGQGERFLVATGDAEVEVRGTVFHVEAHQRHIAVVTVSEGKVEVRYAGSVTLLGPGSEWSPFSPDGASAIPPDAIPGEHDSPPLRALVPGSTAGRAAATIKAEAPPAVSPRTDAPHDGAAAEEPRSKPRAPGEDFAEGMRLIERGDYAAGADKLDAYQHQNPADARAEDAAYLTIIAFQRAGRRDAALAAARSYLQRYPRGYRRAEVESLLSGR